MVCARLPVALRYNVLAFKPVQKLFLLARSYD